MTAVEAVGRVRQRFHDAGLAEVWAPLNSRYDLDSGAYFRHPLALPVVELPDWAAPECPPEARASARASAVAGYLHARILDDRLDADRAELPSPLDDLAASFAMAVHLDLLADAAGPFPVLPIAAQLWGSFARAMADELRLGTTAPDAAEYHRSLDRSRPLILPALAVLGRSGRDPTDLVDLVEAIIDAHQRLTDVLDLQRDTRHGRQTHAWAALGLAEGAAAPFQAGRLDAWFDHIDCLHEQAIASAAHFPGAASWLQRRQSLAHQARTTVWTAVLTRWLSPGTHA